MQKNIEVEDRVKIINPRLNRIGVVKKILEKDESYITIDKKEVIINRKGEYVIEFEDGTSMIKSFSEIEKYEEPA